MKFGGSVITDKSRAFTPRLDVLKRLAAELRKAFERGWRFVVVLGGGSYGHVVVAEFSSKARGEAGAEMVSAATNAMLELALLASDVLSLYRLNPVVMPPHALCSPHGIKPNCRWELVARLLEEGCTPILYGDACLAEQGPSVVSGDELSMEAACSLRADSLIYVTEAGGVLDRSGRLIERLRLDELGTLLEGCTAIVDRARHVDVTGGMRRKLEAVKALACPGLRVAIIGSDEGALIDALEGRVRGTIIEL